MKKLIVITAIAIFSIVTLTGMSFAGSADSESQSSSTATIETNSYSSNERGGHLIDPGFQYGPVINYFGKPLPSDGFQPVESLLMYGTWFSEGALESIIGGDSDAEAEIMVINEELKAPGLFYITKDEKGKVTNKIQWIKIVVSKEPLPDAFQIGYVTARSDDRRTGMPKIMAAAALKAMKKGANVIQFIAQGASRDAFSEGWGIGFNASYGKIFGGSDNDQAVVGGGGTGYSTAEAGMRDKPWLQGHALWVKGLEAPAPSTPVQ
jgi:hypothetical protein